MQIVAFRATPERHRKLLMLAKGERTTVTEILNRLIDNAPVELVEQVTPVLVLSKSNVQAQVPPASTDTC